ncbi:MAG TPA: hypothetical protein VMZ26_08715 [Pyrinomonadaceae bacterium]|nr:hypothetical protein [Pyrinomonadaceae bacterium]
MRRAYLIVLGSTGAPKRSLRYPIRFEPDVNDHQQCERSPRIWWSFFGSLCHD